MKKFMIWFWVLCIPGFLITMLRKFGIGLGFIPVFLLYLCAYYLAKFLCAKADVKTFEKEARKRGLTPGEYASATFPPSLLELCESNKNDTASFEALMKQSIEGDVITKTDANVLRYMFRRK